MYLTVTQMCSAAGHLFIFLRMKNPSLMTRLNNSGSSWVMIMYMNNLATGYGIQFLHLQFMMITGEMNQKLKMMQLMMRLLLMKILINKHKLNRYLQLHHPIDLHINQPRPPILDTISRSSDRTTALENHKKENLNLLF